MPDPTDSKRERLGADLTDPFRIRNEGPRLKFKALLVTEIGRTLRWLLWIVVVVVHMAEPAVVAKLLRVITGWM